MARKAAHHAEPEGWLYRPRFPERWTRRPLYSLALWVNGLAFRDIQFSGSGKPVIKIAEIKDGITGQTKFTTQVFDESVHVTPGDLLFSWSGQPETSIDAFWWRGPDGWLNQHVFKVAPKPEIDRTFFFYLLRYLRPHFVAIARNKQTTGLGHVTKRDLEHIEAAYPSLPEQRAIAAVLGALDDKIELNRRMCRTLEGIARAIFQAWFVDFLPVRAKAAGAKSFRGMPQAVFDTLPTQFVDSPLGPIPKGWSVGTLDQVAAERRESVSPAEIEPATPYIALEHMPRRAVALPDWGTSDDVASGKLKFAQGDILFGKLRPYFHKVGVAPIAGVCSTDIVVVRPASAEWFGFVLGHVSSDEFVAHTDRASTGTKMPRTNWRDMSRYEVVVPPAEVAAEYSRIVAPFIGRMEVYIHASRTLAALRDALLPKLVSGELRIQDVERIIGLPAPAGGQAGRCA